MQRIISQGPDVLTEEPEIEKVSGAGAIYMKSKEVQEGLPFDTFNTPTVIDCFENQRIISMGLGRSHALGVLETSDLYCWGSNAHLGAWIV